MCAGANLGPFWCVVFEPVEKNFGGVIRVLTTASRKPPLRTGKFVGFRGERCCRASDAGLKCAESGYCALIGPRKGLTSDHEAGERAEMAWSNDKSAAFDLKTAVNGISARCG